MVLVVVVVDRGRVVEVVGAVLVVDGGAVVDDVDVLDVDDVDDVVVGAEAGRGNAQESRPRVAWAMYFCQITVGNEPPVTDLPCTFFISLAEPSGLASG